ncbi:MAG: hypothetical protein ABIJ20_01800 [Nanoarchaeota archaeon]|nr:hypothetical protein [Nanoarchaeota archaeon]MBU2406652.1 hypothetical protein [Nanoarchaeota archaeon]MBU2475022.1 hypothetical protein [Nanoarchaeota archaeon]
MKKLILILTIFLLISNAFAINLDQSQMNGLIDEEKAELAASELNFNEIENLSIRQIMEISLETSPPEIPNQIKKFLPFHIKLNVRDTNETFIIAMGKTGDITLLDEGKHHILVEFNLEQMRDLLLNAQTSQELNGLDLLNRLEITPNSFKGALMLNVIEKMAKQQIVNKRSFGYKTIGVITTPISWFIR